MHPQVDAHADVGGAGDDAPRCWRKAKGKADWDGALALFLNERAEPVVAIEPVETKAEQ